MIVCFLALTTNLSQLLFLVADQILSFQPIGMNEFLLMNSIRSLGMKLIPGRAV